LSDGLLKFCPECGEEFVRTALRCADCDVDLVTQEPGAPAAAGADAAGDGGMPLPGELAPLLKGEPWELERIAEALAEGGIPCRVDPFPPEGGRELAIYVRPETLDDARHVLEGYRAASLPDAPEDSALGVDLHDCPACGAALPEESTECPDCGLPFAEAEL